MPPDVGLTERDCMLRAIEQARRCTNEAGKVSPKVGAVIMRDGAIMGEAYRGELADGDHAEYTLLEKKLHDAKLTGATLFTTLEQAFTITATMQSALFIGAAPSPNPRA